MSAVMATLQAELKKELSDVFETISENRWTRLNPKSDSGEMEDNLSDMGRWDIGVKDALIQLLHDYAD